MSERPQNNYERRSRSIHKTEDYSCTAMIEHLEQSDLPDKSRVIKKLEDCATYRRNGLKTMKKRNFCNLRYLCKSCTDREALGYAMSYSNRIMNLMVRFELCPLFMTLRPTSGSDLVQQLLQLNSYLTKIQQQRSNYLHHGKRFTEFCRFQYALAMIEVARASDTTLWFPHVHAIVLNPISNALFDIPALADEWTTISGLTIRPHVEPTKAGDLFQDSIRSQQLTIQTRGAIINHLKNLIVYSLKMSAKDQPPLCPADLIAVRSAMYRRQRIREWPMSKIQRSIPASKV